MEIARGHLDVRLTQASGEGGLTYGLAVKDDSLTNARTSVLRTVGSTTLAVAPNARFVRPASLSDPSYDVLGPVGTATYVLPETQNSDIVWPGLSTEGIDYAALPDGADLTLHLAQAPEGARVAFFQGGTFGAGAKVHFDSSKGDGVVHTTEATHMHGNWVFSTPGTYRIEVGARSGERSLVEPQSFTVIVRSGHRDEQPAPVDEEPVPTPSPGPAPTPEPTPAPSPSVDPTPAPSVDPAPAPSRRTLLRRRASTLRLHPAPAPAPHRAPIRLPRRPRTRATRTQRRAPRTRLPRRRGRRPTPFPAPAPSGGPVRVPAPSAPSGNAGTPASSGATRTSGPAATGGSASAAPAARSNGAASGTTGATSSAPVSAPKAAPAPSASPSAAPQSGAQSGAHSGAAASPEAGTSDAAASLPVAAAADTGRSGGWSPYWLVLLVIPAALAGGGAGYLIRTR